MLRGARRLGFKFTLTMAAYDLIRCRSCSGQPPERSPKATTFPPLPVRSEPKAEDGSAWLRFSAAC